MTAYDDYDQHSAENEPDWPAPEYQPDEEPGDDWPGLAVAA